jgi:hypothetical protein
VLYTVKSFGQINKDYLFVFLSIVCNSVSVNATLSVSVE